MIFTTDYLNKLIAKRVALQHEARKIVFESRFLLGSNTAWIIQRVRGVK